MSADLLTQLAEYGANHRERQQPIGLDEVVPEGDEIVPAGAVPRLNDRRKPVFENPTRVWLAAAAAAVIIVALAMALVLRPSADSDLVEEPDGGPAPTTVAPTTTEPSTTSSVFSTEDALTVVETYYEAFNAQDVDSALAQFTNDQGADMTYCYGRSTDCVPDGPVSWAFATNFTTYRSLKGDRVLERTCGVTLSDGAFHTFECRYTEETNFTRAAGTEPVPVVDMITVGADGISAYHRLVGPPDYLEAGEPYGAWIERFHPGVDDATGCCEWETRADAERGALLSEQYAEAWHVYLEAFGCLGEPTCPAAGFGSGVVDAFAAIYNNGNMDALAGLLTEVTQLTGHPQAPTASGRDEVLAAIEADRAVAATDEPLTVSNVVIDGGTITWDHVWTAADGTTWCGTGNTAQVSIGRMNSWAFASDHAPCEQ